MTELLTCPTVWFQFFLSHFPLYSRRCRASKLVLTVVVSLSIDADIYEFVIVAGTGSSQSRRTRMMSGFLTV